MSSINSSSIESKHTDMIHDAQLDFYGTQLATCSSDRSIKIFNVSDDQTTFVCDLLGHEGPVWQVAWAHPKFGNILASCSHDTSVFIWKETSQHVWEKIYTHDVHKASVNSICWAPHEFGLILACGSSDNQISVLMHSEDEGWLSPIVKDSAHPVGCNAVSWSPSVPSTEGDQILRLVSGGCDNEVKVWELVDGSLNLSEQSPAQSHSDWVRDVAWAPSVGLPSSVIASCSQDKTVKIWTQEKAGEEWQCATLPTFNDTVWRVSWSMAGNILAVSCGDNTVSLWKQSLDTPNEDDSEANGWIKISNMKEGGQLDDISTTQ